MIEAQRREDQQKFLTFLLEEEEYGVDIMRVQEIRGWEKARPMPDTPEYVIGMLNLRGDVMPVIDLRLRFGLEALEYSSTTVVVIVRVDFDGQDRGIGLVVDAVSDVHAIKPEQLKAPPRFGGAIRSDLLQGLATVGEHMIFLLDLDRLVKASVMADVTEQVSQDTEHGGEDSD